uniref:Uncharacterized protein n=1 Tax=Strigamia maritima TaxID=126957 RepID=T1JAQ4_STRMM
MAKFESERQIKSHPHDIAYLRLGRECCACRDRRTLHEKQPVAHMTSSVGDCKEPEEPIEVGIDSVVLGVPEVHIDKNLDFE